MPIKPSIKPIAAPRLYQRIAEEIGRLIESGTFKAGDRLPAERELARQLQVSRSSLREALSMLELQGSVEIRLGSGVYVATRKRGSRAAPALSAASPFDISRTRRLVEGEAAALAARHATSEQGDEAGVQAVGR
jgi:GntR family transcriptional regulator, transcriptional repressor for pyruvate dehydrogenase complex